MDMHYIEALCCESDSLRSEIIALNSKNPRFADALDSAMGLIQMKPFLSRKFLKGFRLTTEYRAMHGKDLFEALVDVELDIKREFHEEAKKKAVSLEALLQEEY